MIVATISTDRPPEELDAILEKLQIGQEVVVTHQGIPVAHLSSVARRKKPLPLDELDEFRARMPRLDRPFVELLREMKDEYR